MLTHPPHDRLLALGLTGSAKALEEQRRSIAFDDLSFEERPGILVDREAAERDGKKLASRLKFAALSQNAGVVDLDLRTRPVVVSPQKRNEFWRAKPGRSGARRADPHEGPRLERRLGNLRRIRWFRRGNRIW